MSVTVSSLPSLTPARSPLVPLRLLLALLAGGIFARASVQVELVGGGSPLPGQAVPGSTVTLRVKAIGQGGNANAQVAFGETDLTKASFQWYRGGNALPGATSSTLVLPNISAADAGNYSVHVTSRAPASDWGTVAVNVADAPGTQFVDPSFSAKATVSPSFNYLDYARVDRIETILADGSVVVSGQSLGNFKGWKVYNSSGVLVHGWAQDVIHYAVSTRFWPDGTIVTSTSNPGSPGQPSISVVSVGGQTPPALPSGFDYPMVDAVLVDGANVLIAQDARLIRMDANRTVDPTFTGMLPADTVDVVDLKRDAQGRYLATVISAGLKRTLVRLNRSGALDSTFTSIAIPPAALSPANLPLDWTGPYPQADGRLLWATPKENGDEIGIIRFQEDGTRDPFFAGAVPATGRLDIDSLGRCYVLIDGRVWRYFADKDRALDPGFYPGAPDDRITDLRLDPTARLVVAGAFAAWNGHPSVHIARLLPIAGPAPSRPAVWLNVQVANNPHWLFVSAGDRVSISPHILGTGPFSYEWVALDGGSLPSDSRAPTLEFASFSAVNFGRYQLRLTSPGGVSLSDPVDLSAASLPPVGLMNLSGRATIGVGENALFAGFVQESSRIGQRTFLVRGAGPALKRLGVSTAATDPVMDLFEAAGQPIMRNDDWPAELASVSAGLGAFPFDANSKDSALMTSLSGLHSIQLTDRDVSDGIGLVEIYDAFDPSYYPGRLVNLSLRSHVGQGDKLSIAGFVIVDPAGFRRSLSLLIRGIGPALTNYGIQNPLVDPKLTVFNATGAALGMNDNWSQNADPVALAATMKQLGAFDLPSNSKDAALQVELPAGSYTAHLSGVNGGTGVALLEIYLVR